MQIIIDRDLVVNRKEVLQKGKMFGKQPEPVIQENMIFSASIRVEMTEGERELAKTAGFYEPRIDAIVGSNLGSLTLKELVEVEPKRVALDDVDAVEGVVAAYVQALEALGSKFKIVGAYANKSIAEQVIEIA